MDIIFDDHLGTQLEMPEGSQDGKQGKNAEESTDRGSAGEEQITYDHSLFIPVVSSD